MKADECPVCGSTQLEPSYPAHVGRCITSDMMVLPASSLQNALCSSCGQIFNAGGTRGWTLEFYRNSYNLMMTRPENSIQSFSGSQPMSQAERTYLILRELVELPPRGRMLEAGAGKGEFLRYFTAGMNGWEFSAFEPSEAYHVLRAAYPAQPIQHCDFADYGPEPGKLDLLVALGVLEHVENPLEMLRWGNRLLAEGGVFYIRVPNFAKNPNDLFCADHLSKLTEATLRNLAVAAGFTVLGMKEAGVPIFVALRKTNEPLGALGNVADQNRGILDQNVAVARRIVDAIVAARRAAIERREAFAIFGLASAGLFAPLFAEFEAGEIAAYIDENRTVWGGTVHGRPIGGLDLIERERIRHVALSISPVYIQQVSAKLRPLGVKIYAA
jgi:SAM-dependent methyltransferase